MGEEFSETPRYTIPFGVDARVDAEQQLITFLKNMFVIC